MWLFHISLLALGLLFFLIWRKAISDYYRRRLRNMEVESLRQELVEKEEQIRRLIDNNDSLAHIIHRDNKLIPAMLTSVRDYLRTADEAPQRLKEKGNALSARLEELADGRSGILSEYEHERGGIPMTGLVAVDGMLSYMCDRAAESGVTFEVKLGETFTDAISEKMTEADCAKLLADLVENALIAAAHNSGGERAVLVHLGVLYEYPVIEISDSGAPFEPAVYQDFGMEMHSTHLDEGGSGIGLMDIWNTKKRYKASLHIYEMEPKSGKYTKKISFVLDRKGHYLIRTYRVSELSAHKIRGDLFILPMR